VKPRSLRSRLIVGTAVSLTLIFLAAGTTLYLLMRASLIREFDAAMLTEAAAVASLTEQDKGTIEVETQPPNLPQFSRKDRPHYFEIWRANGESVARSASMGAGHFAQPEARLQHDWMSLPDGVLGRVVVQPFVVRDESLPKGQTAPTLTLLLARDTIDLQQTLSQLRTLIIVVGAASVLAGLLSMAFVVRRGMHPLDDIARSIERVGVNNLSERIEPNGTPREIVPVVQRLNDLLHRVEDVVIRERGFTADVAHELRTPLAGLSSTLEVSASRPRDPSAYADTAEKCLRVTRGMQTMVNNLLLLARADAKQLTGKTQRVDLARLLRECWEPNQEQAIQRGLQVKWNIAAAESELFSDPELLRMIVNNLFANAVTYSDAGGIIEIELKDRTLVVSNSASGFAPADAARVFDRFWRADAARTQAGVRCGLGLPLCKKLAEVLGGTITATCDGGMFRASLSLAA
jgi:two-component system OmpR family sensor kinase